MTAQSATFSQARKSPTHPMPDTDLYFQTQEAAQKLGYTVQGVARLIRLKKLEAIRIGKMYLVSKRSVDDYLKITKGKDKNDPSRGKKSEQ
ncbi:MAG: DNA-binding protein [Anaerolineaceae bacterium]|nr:MAG: DNA-binding protein [Anaerolineaceae bacterium]